MAKNRSLAEQIEEIEKAQEKLSIYNKLFDKACQMNFNCNTKKIQKIIETNETFHTDFLDKICSFFMLNNEKDREDFLSFLCTEENLNHFNNRNLS